MQDLPTCGGQIDRTHFATSRTEGSWTNRRGLRNQLRAFGVHDRSAQSTAAGAAEKRRIARHQSDGRLVVLTVNKSMRFVSCPERPPYRKVLLTWRGVLTRESESFGPFGTGTVSKCGISERHPVFRLELESREAADGNAESLDVVGDTKKRRALSRLAFFVNHWGEKVCSRKKGSPWTTLFVTTRARPESGSHGAATLCRSSSSLR